MWQTEIDQIIQAQAQVQNQAQGQAPEGALSVLEITRVKKLPGIFDPTMFSPRRPVARSVFIKAMHPKTEIQPSLAAIGKILKAGWVGQMKIHGHRAQI